MKMSPTTPAVSNVVEKDKKIRRRGRIAGQSREEQAVLDTPTQPNKRKRGTGKEKEEALENKVLDFSSTLFKGKATVSTDVITSSSTENSSKRSTHVKTNNILHDKTKIAKTKLRNLLKRKAKQRGRENVTLDEEEGQSNDTQTNSNKNNKKKPKANAKNSGDPSCSYLDDPTSAPVVRRASTYMNIMLNKNKSNNKNKKFHITTGSKKHWRTVSKMAVRKGSTNKNNNGDSSILQIGLFKPKSHDIVPVPNCIAHHPSINLAVPIIQKACISCNVQAFSEQDGTGHLRYLAINVERSTGALQVTLVWNRNSDSSTNKNNNENDDKNVLDALIQAIIGYADDSSSSQEKTNIEEKQFKLHSLWVHYHSPSKHDNAIFGRDSNSWKCVHGPTTITETIDIRSIGTSNDGTSSSSIDGCPYKVALEFPPNVFRQANLDGFAPIIGVIRDRIVRYNAEEREEDLQAKKSLPSCVELYGGVGTIGLHLVDLTCKFVSSDENPYNVECFQRAASTLPKKLKSRVSYVPKNAADMVAAGALLKSELLIVDPPRKGLDPEVLDDLIRTDICFPKLLVYVSCGFPAFERDCNRLIQSGIWKLDHAQGFLLFPGSDAIETLAFFVRTD